MPYYQYECEKCGWQKGDMRTVEERHDAPDCWHGHGKMKLIATPVKGFVKNPAVPRGSR